ncbi:hypothetical protein FT165_19685 [Bordetella pertussis]|nr:hypothetical protein FT165_19685 [Bordetella pertussis]
MNAFDGGLLMDLRRAIDACRDAQPEVRVIVIRGPAGPSARGTT